MTSSAVGRDETLLPVAGVHARRFDDEVVILDLAGGDYYALNTVGARVWEELVGGKTPAEIARVVAAEFQVEPERAMSDCLALIDELVTRGLVRRRT
jgi:hypothetical protein